jgi:glycosyltransferase involved in cell wall biosynthesis
VNSTKSGVGFYTHHLITSLAEQYPEEIELVGHYFNFLGKKKPTDLPTAKNIRYKQSRILPGKILSLSRRLGDILPLEALFRCKGDVTLFTNFVNMPSLFKTPSILVVHDLCYKEVPQYVSEKNRLYLVKNVPKSIKRSQIILTISLSTKEKITQFYSVSEEKIILTPIPPIEKPSNTTKKSKLDKNYILFVSTLEPRKNVINLVKAYEKLDKKIHNNYSLILAGGSGWYMDETLSYIDSLQKEGFDIITPGYISEEEKDSLYHNASLFVFPSHYEGFGMPILEAMSYGIPTAVSDIPVFHEVSNKASVYFDKDDPISIATAIEKILTSKKLQNQLIQDGYENLKRFSWQQNSKLLFDEIHKIINSKIKN